MDYPRRSRGVAATCSPRTVLPTPCSTAAHHECLVPAQAHAVCFALGVATTQLCEAAAVATQTLLAREFYAGGAVLNEDRRRRAGRLVRLGVGAGLLCSSTLAVVTFLNRKAVIGGLTTDPAVRAACVGVFPLVMLCQIMKGVAYPVNGCLMGGLDWSAARGRVRDRRRDRRDATAVPSTRPRTRRRRRRCGHPTPRASRSWSGRRRPASPSSGAASRRSSASSAARASFASRRARGPGAR